MEEKKVELYDVYSIENKNEELNKLGEIGWEVINQSPFLIVKPFKMDENAKILDQFEAWINTQANKDRKVLDWLKDNGFSFSRVYSDEKGKKVNKVKREGALLDWRLEVEVDPNEVYLLVGMTFGPITMNTPLFYARDVIDKYVPKELNDELQDGHGIKPTQIAESGKDSEK